MSRNRPLLTPQYMRRFMCIGSQCEDTCCFGWRVNIDRATYRKYRRVTDPELRQELDSCIKRNRSQPGEQNYARIKMDRGKACPFLNEESLCRIQLRLGEEFLSDICVTYPRVANLVNNVLEKSATMSCPEAARLALLNPGGDGV